MTTRRNPQDATRRNVQAGAKRTAALLAAVKAQRTQLATLDRRVSVLERQMRQLIRER